MARLIFLLPIITVLGIITLADTRDPFPYPYYPIRYLASTSQIFRQALPPPFQSRNEFPLLPDRAALSCRRKCGLPPNPKWPCQCHSECQELDDCCHDFEDLCFTCAGRCNKYVPLAPCQCNKKCTQFENCCSDYESKCSKARAPIATGAARSWFAQLGRNDDDSCVGRCHQHDTSKPCQCNEMCEYFADCCDDYEEVCVDFPTTCLDRCGEYDPARPCQCNNQCEQYENCCPDFPYLCLQLPGGVTDEMLAALSEELLTMDTGNNVAPFIAVNLQGRSNQDGSDQAPLPLLTVDPAAYQKPTVAKLITLLDNYVAEVGTPEDETPQEKEEVDQFLDEVLSTPIMVRTAAFLAERGFIPNNFRQTFKKIWFGMYSRANNAIGSSGFEHVFLGELKNGVSGFHHWAFWAKEETLQELNYKGYIATHSLGPKGMVLSESFDWRNADKRISSMFIGPSPEFELAVYTICWYARPDALCPLVLNGKRIRMQTYLIVHRGENYVATAYPNL